MEKTVKNTEELLPYKKYPKMPKMLFVLLPLRKQIENKPKTGKKTIVDNIHILSAWLFSPPLRSVDYYFAMLRSFPHVFL